MSKPQFHIAIVGAGLGGLAAAISIAQAGYKAIILEQAAELGEVCIYRYTPQFRTRADNTRLAPASKFLQTHHESSRSSASWTKSKHSQSDPTSLFSEAIKMAKCYQHSLHCLSANKNTAPLTCISIAQTIIVCLSKKPSNLVYLSSSDLVSHRLISRHRKSY